MTSPRRPAACLARARSARAAARPRPAPPPPRTCWPPWCLRGTVGAPARAGSGWRPGPLPAGRTGPGAPPAPAAGVFAAGGPARRPRADRRLRGTSSWPASPLLVRGAGWAPLRACPWPLVAPPRPTPRRGRSGPRPAPCPPVRGPTCAAPGPARARGLVPVLRPLVPGRLLGRGLPVDLAVPGRLCRPPPASPSARAPRRVVTWWCCVRRWALRVSPLGQLMPSPSGPRAPTKHRMLPAAAPPAGPAAWPPLPVGFSPLSSRALFRLSYRRPALPPYLGARGASEAAVPLSGFPAPTPRARRASLPRPGLVPPLAVPLALPACPSRCFHPPVRRVAAGRLGPPSAGPRRALLRRPGALPPGLAAHPGGGLRACLPLAGFSRRPPSRPGPLSGAGRRAAPAPPPPAPPLGLAPCGPWRRFAPLARAVPRSRLPAPANRPLRLLAPCWPPRRVVPPRPPCPASAWPLAAGLCRRASSPALGPEGRGLPAPARRLWLRCRGGFCGARFPLLSLAPLLARRAARRSRRFRPPPCVVPNPFPLLPLLRRPRGWFGGAAPRRLAACPQPCSLCSWAFRPSPVPAAGPLLSGGSAARPPPPLPPRCRPPSARMGWGPSPWPVPPLALARRSPAPCRPNCTGSGHVFPWPPALAPRGSPRPAPAAWACACRPLPAAPSIRGPAAASRPPGCGRPRPAALWLALSPRAPLLPLGRPRARPSLPPARAPAPLAAGWRLARSAPRLRRRRPPPSRSSARLLGLAVPVGGLGLRC